MYLKESTVEERRVQKLAFRQEFLKTIPVGTVVLNTNLETDEGKAFFAKTAGGEIYENETSELVNVTEINGVPDFIGVWTAAFLRKKE